jgi:hypothetical protein
MTVGLMCIGCFLVGAKVGQQVSKGEKIETPELNPMKVYREHKDKKQAEWEQSRVDIILQNIDNYDGTSRGQKEVPRG